MGRTKGALGKKTKTKLLEAVKPATSNIKVLINKEKTPVPPAQESKKEEPVKEINEYPVNSTDDSESLNAFKETYGTNTPPLEIAIPTDDINNEETESEPESTPEKEPSGEIDYSLAEEKVEDAKENLKNERENLAKEKELAKVKADGGNQKTDDLIFITNFVAPFIIKNAHKIGATPEKRKLINEIDSYDMRLTEKQKQRLIDDGAIIATAEKYMPLIDPAIRATFAMLGCYETNYNDNMIALKDKLENKI